MLPYLSLSCRNPHTVIWSNLRIILIRHRSSCIPNPASILSTSCYNCIFNVVCCWVGRALVRSRRTFCNNFILWGSFYSSYFFPVRCSCGCVPCAVWSFFFELGATDIETWRGAAATLTSLFLYIFTTPSLGCRPLAVYGCGGVSALFGALLIVLWLRLLLY